MGAKSNIFKGLILGTLVGGVLGILFAPKSGKETRDDLKKLAEKAKESATGVYMQARVLIIEKLEQLKEVGSKIDQKVYLKIVNQVIDELRNDNSVTDTALAKLSRQLKRDWNEVKNLFASEVK